MNITPKQRRVAAYVLVSLAFGVGLLRLESVSNEAHNSAVRAEDLAERVTELVVLQEEDRQTSALSACLLRNTAQRNSRNRWIQVQANLRATERGAEVADQLLVGVELNPLDEDRDCNLDGVLDDKDYTDVDSPSLEFPLEEPSQGTNTTSSTTLARRIAAGASSSTSTSRPRSSLPNRDGESPPLTDPSINPERSNDLIDSLEDILSDPTDPVCEHITDLDTGEVICR